jgi:superfamily I DNA and RNA helicase
MEQALSKLDHPTLHTAVSMVSQVGFSHFNLSKDTRIALEARKAHRFVAINCEEISKKILRLTGASATEIEDQLRQIARQIQEFNEANPKPEKKIL